MVQVIQVLRMTIHQLGQMEQQSKCLSTDSSCPSRCGVSRFHMQACYIDRLCDVLMDLLGSLRGNYTRAHKVHLPVTLMMSPYHLICSANQQEKEGMLAVENDTPALRVTAGATILQYREFYQCLLECDSTLCCCADKCAV
jgi:hypothetical protein